MRNEGNFSGEKGVPKEIETKIRRAMPLAEFKNLLENSGGTLEKNRRLLKDWRYRLDSNLKKRVATREVDLPTADLADDKNKILELLQYLGLTVVAEDDKSIRAVVRTFPLPVRSVRLRDDGGQLEWTVKERVSGNDKKNQGAVAKRGEAEVKMNNFKAVRRLLERMGYNLKYEREKFRTTYRLGNAKVELNEAPRVPSVIEIEAPEESDVLEAVKILGFKPSELANMTDTEYLLASGRSEREVQCLTFSGKHLKG